MRAITTNAIHYKRCTMIRGRGLVLVLAISLLIFWNAYLTHRLMLMGQSDCITPSSLDCSSIFVPTKQQQQQKQQLAYDEKRGNITVPDWHRAVDCSVWDNMCGATSNVGGRYEPYPFPLSRHIKNLHNYHHRPMSDVPEEWMGALMVDNSIDKPPGRPISYIYPPEVHPGEVAKCLRESIDLTWKQQIEKLLDSGRIAREATTNMVAFTISDFNYAHDMMHDVFEMNSNIVGFDGSFFMVALDEDTMEMACRYGYPAAAWHGGAKQQSPDQEAHSRLKRDVANTKFEVSSMLASGGVDFFFYEMDVWFLTSPKELIAGYHGESQEHDMLLSSHMKDPQSVNIGVYSVTANNRTREFFELCILILTRNKSPAMSTEAAPGKATQHIL